MLPFLRYKEKESDLQVSFGKVPVTIEEITDTDNYYTDGDSTRSTFKVIIDSLMTVYVPQFIYNVNPIYREKIMEWIATVEK